MMFLHGSLCLQLKLDFSSSLPPCIGPSRTSKIVKTSCKYCTIVQHLAPLRYTAEGFQEPWKVGWFCAGPLQHPQLCIDAVEHGVRHGGRSGLQAEAVAFATAAKLPVHQALVHIFFAQRGTKKVSLRNPSQLLYQLGHACL
jgi:hypothetical protein